MVVKKDHPRANRNGHVPKHILVVESAMGKNLRLPAVVHHINGNKADNRASNLVVCNDTTYHMLLHARERARDACGDPNKRLCSFCKEYDFPENMYPNGYSYRHSGCARQYANARYARMAASQGRTVKRRATTKL